MIYRRVDESEIAEATDLGSVVLGSAILPTATTL